MACIPSLGTVKSAFGQSVFSAANLYNAVTPYVEHGYKGITENPLHPRQARRVVGLAFLSLVAAWEDFVQALFVRYMAGASSPGGYRPTLRLGPCTTLRHAAEVLTGRPGFDLESRYLSWTKWSEVTSLASLHFVKGRPCTSSQRRAYHPKPSCTLVTESPPGFLGGRAPISGPGRECKDCARL